VVSLVTRCEKLGLVQRQEGRSDRREVEIHLTPKGNELVALLAGLHRDELIRMQGIFQIPGSDDLGVGEDAGR
jgi:DNA-binding MarR family transcriptional regulator